MITTINDYLNSTLPKVKLCIVGTGAAGLELATQLENSFDSILLIDSGFETFDWHTQKLAHFQQKGMVIRSVDPNHPLNLEIAREQQTHLRQYGGTLNIWGGKWKALDPIDFSPKLYLQETGWPITYEELHPYYHAIAEDYDIADLIWLNNHPNELPSTISQLPCFYPSIDLLECIPTNSSVKFHKRLKDSSSITVVLGASAVNILLSENLKHVTKLNVRSLNGDEWTVQAELFVLACGSIETTKLLLSSNSQLEKGIGNQTDWVGRNLLDHPKGYVGMLFPYDLKDITEARTFFDSRNKILEIGIALHPNLLREWELPNHCMNIFPRLHGSKLAYAVKIYLEQLPNRESRLFLTNDRDTLNMPVACLDWKFRELDKTCFKRFIEKMTDLLDSNRIGRLVTNPDYEELTFLRDASHQMGTTRMAMYSTNGVVDPNCKIFGVDNLYLMSSSVFPMAGNANPTLTILALARRLASHLKQEQKKQAN